jgi:hypothetical protein
MNPPVNQSQRPPEFETILKDPRLDDLKERPDWLPRERRVLQPANPPVAGESPFLLLREWNEESFAAVDWLNGPKGIGFTLDTGRGQGFRLITETPRFREQKKKPAQRADAWRYSNWLIVSAAFADVVRSFDAEAIETLPIDWEFSDGLKLDGYQFLDVKRLEYAYDYHRSAVRVEIKKGRKFVAGLEHPRALKPGLDPALRIFRDAYHRQDIFMSRDLARALTQADMKCIRFEDPASTDTVRF